MNIKHNRHISQQLTHQDILKDHQFNNTSDASNCIDLISIATPKFFGPSRFIGSNYMSNADRESVGRFSLVSGDKPHFVVQEQVVTTRGISQKIDHNSLAASSVASHRAVQSNGVVDETTSPRL